MSWVATTGCQIVIEGVKRALEADQKIATLYLVGKQSDIQGAMRSAGLDDERVQVVHASEVMTMDDKPTVALRKKKDSSMVRAIELVGEGRGRRSHFRRKHGRHPGDFDVEAAPASRSGAGWNCDSHTDSE